MSRYDIVNEVFDADVYKRQPRVLVKGQDVHQHKVYVCPAAAFDLKGVPEDTRDAEPLVRPERCV